MFEKLADFLNDVEASAGDWPEKLLLQIASLIPKEDSASALCAWEEACAHESQWDYGRGKRSIDPSWISFAAAEHAWLWPAHHVGVGVSLDFCTSSTSFHRGCLCRRVAWLDMQADPSAVSS